MHDGTAADAVFWGVDIQTLERIVADLGKRYQHYQGEHPQALRDAWARAEQVLDNRR